MGHWAQHAVEMLQRGESAEVKPRGNSMKGKVESGSTVLVKRLDPVEVGDVVLVKVKGNVYLHLVKAKQGDRYQIGNNRGGINGWVGRGAIFGTATTVNGTVIKDG
jgi:SOS-response transcriptional repressor LexA